ncbi:MAG: hypothetical protein J6T55_02450 [Alphaproteobacteria bacterium]|nr:hypothetical protein [Alphaproteobacteria bacterium]
MKKKKRIRFNKKLYIYMAFVTMAAVSLFAKPFKKGLSALNRRLRKSSKKGELRAQLALNQQPPHSFETNTLSMTAPKKRGR